jgi:hypothetical protein
MATSELRLTGAPETADLSHKGQGIKVLAIMNKIKKATIPPPQRSKLVDIIGSSFNFNI